MRYSFIIPVYNRPEEVDELLNSLTRQTNKNFEVLIVEDGSSVPCKEVVDNYADRLDICYYFKSNSGPGQTRNYGAERGHGEYLIILDSDCILPEGYLAAVESELQRQKADAFGGPDRAHDLINGVDFLLEGMVVDVVSDASTETVLFADVPVKVQMKITYTEPGLKGDTATNTLKPATVESGATVRVPLFINEGETIEIDTRDGSYVGRVKA